MKQRILIIYSHNQGLLSGFYQELSGMLADDGHAVFNFSIKQKRADFEVSGVQVIVRPKRNLLDNYFQIFKVIRQTKPDVVVSNFGYINPALLCGKLLGVPRNIAWFHTAFSHSKRHWFHVWFKKQCFRLADVVITNSETLNRDMIRYYGVKPQQLCPIPFWTHIDALKAGDVLLGPIPQDVLKIGCPGRLVIDKNHAVVVEALAKIDKQYPSWQMYIAGDGPDRSQLQEKISASHLDQKVTFLGNLSAEAMKRFYQSMDLIVLPSLHEAFGLVFIEAIALDTPVLVSKAFGALDFIDTKQFDVSAFVFDPEDSDALAAKLLPYFLGKGLDAAYFKSVYSGTFSKSHIYLKIKQAIIGSY